MSSNLKDKSEMESEMRGLLINPVNGFRHIQTFVNLVSSRGILWNCGDHKPLTPNVVRRPRHERSDTALCVPRLHSTDG